MTRREREIVAAMAALGCVFAEADPLEKPCPEEWPQQEETWCAPCFARRLLAVTA